MLGMARSGTTVMFDVLAAHPDLGWFSSHLNRIPGLPAVSFLSRLADLDPRFRKSKKRSDQRRPGIEKLRVGPAESYAVWNRCCGEKFANEFLVGIEATEDERRCVHRLVRKVLAYQGRKRFATKITGPARIGYLSSIFDDALFLHVVRDGRAVVQSLMNVAFWKDTWRRDQVAWQNAVPETELQAWRDSGGSPLALAAIQWAAVVTGARMEGERFAPDRYAEVRYEDFIGDPHRVIDELTDFCGLAPAREMHEFVDHRLALRDMNYQWATRFDAGQIEMLNEIMGDSLSSFGYVDEHESLDEERLLVNRPFATR